jgi:hypothetical protein
MYLSINAFSFGSDGRGASAEITLPSLPMSMYRGMVVMLNCFMNEDACSYELIFI